MVIVTTIKPCYHKAGVTCHFHMWPHSHSTRAQASYAAFLQRKTATWSSADTFVHHYFMDVSLRKKPYCMLCFADSLTPTSLVSCLLDSQCGTAQKTAWKQVALICYCCSLRVSCVSKCFFCLFLLFLQLAVSLENWGKGLLFPLWHGMGLVGTLDLVCCQKGIPLLY